MLAYIATVALVLAIVLLIIRAEGDESVGFGGVLEMQDGAGDTYVAVPKIEVLGVPNPVTGIVESKTLDLPEATIRKLGTLVNGGTFTFKYHMIAATHARVEAIRVTRLPKNFRVKVPVDTGVGGFLVVTVPGIVTQNQIEDLEAEKITVGNVTVEVSGAAIPP